MVLSNPERRVGAFRRLPGRRNADRETMLEQQDGQKKNNICLFGAWSRTSEDMELRTLVPRAESATPSETGSLPVID